jgi:hypothetical protein
MTSGIVSETVEGESGGEVSVSDCPPLPQGVKLVCECSVHCVLSSVDSVTIPFHICKRLTSDVSLNSLLQQGFVCIILGQTKRINKYLRGIMQRIGSEQNLSVLAAEKRVNRNRHQGQGHEA